MGLIETAARQTFLGASVLVCGCWWLLATIVSDELFQLFDSHAATVKGVLALSVDLIEGVKLLLQLNDGLIALIQASSKGNHDVALFLKETLVSIYLSLLFVDLFSLSFNLD